MVSLSNHLPAYPVILSEMKDLVVAWRAPLFSLACHCEESFRGRTTWQSLSIV